MNNIGDKSIAIVTGATGSIGSAAVKILAQRGFNVIMACRNINKGEEIKNEIIKEMPDVSLEVMRLDIASRKSIVNFTEEINNKGVKPKKLLNNAGTLCRSFSLNEDGVEMTKTVNYFGTVMLTKLMIPLMDNDFSIVNTISLSCHFSKIDESFFNFDSSHFSQIGTYGESKLALLLSSLTLSQTLPDGCHLNMSDPGIVNTKMITMQRWFDPLTDILFRPFCNSPEKGAYTAINALMSDENGKLFFGKKCKDISKKYMNHPCREWLWDETNKFLNI